MPSASDYPRVKDRETLDLMINGITSKTDLVKEITKAREAFALDEADDSVSDRILDLRSGNLAIVTKAMRSGNLEYAVKALRCFWSDAMASAPPMAPALNSAREVHAPSI